MTVFAIKDGVIAVDSMVSSGGHFVGHSQKWREVPAHLGGGFVLASGVVSRATAIMDAVAAHGMNARIETDDEVTVLWIKSDKTIWAVEREAIYQIDAEFIAEGSGRAYAYGALAAGADVQEAVRIACEFDAGCGGRITVLRVE